MKTEKKITTLQWAKHYQDLADQSSHKNGMWKGAYLLTARTMRTYHRSRAATILSRAAKDCKGMSIACVFEAAANFLR